MICKHCYSDLIYTRPQITIKNNNVCIYFCNIKCYGKFLHPPGSEEVKGNKLNKAVRHSMVN